MLRPRILVIVICLACSTLSSCVSLTRSEREVLSEVSYYGIDRESEGTNSKFLAGFLNILPGVGNAYLGQWGFGILNFLFWPPSVVWGVPQAFVDAGTLNEKETADFYRTHYGREVLDRIRVHSARPVRASLEEPTPIRPE